jgi:hypothetical protein
VVYRRQEPPGSASPQPPSLGSKKNSASILSSFQQLWDECRPAFSQQRLADSAQILALSNLLCLSRHTLTGLLTTCGREFQDWSAAYRLFSRHRFPVAEVFSVVRRSVLAELDTDAPFCVSVDDTLLPKAGPCIPGVGWRRDPLGPRFQTNFIRAQRFLQFSASVPLGNSAHRLVPISFCHAPAPPKLSSKASPEEIQEHRRVVRRTRLPLRASQQIASLRQTLDAEHNSAQRQLRVFVDNGYTNETTLKDLPPRTGLVGRIRKDAKLYFLPKPTAASRQRGRPRHYGAPAPTPEQLRLDASVPWSAIEVNIRGISRSTRVKVLKNLQWRTAGLNHTLQLVVIAPLGYQLRKNSKILYRQPAFLICTESELDLHSLVQGYVQRWDIEVNFREEKTLLGVGQAQVRNAESVESVPAFQVASYAMLLLASLHATQGSQKPDLLPPPKWAENNPPRFSTQRAINQLRAEVWGRALGIDNFSGFATRAPTVTKPEKFLLPLSSAVLYAVN